MLVPLPFSFALTTISLLSSLTFNRGHGGWRFLLNCRSNNISTSILLGAFSFDRSFTRLIVGIMLIHSRTWTSQFSRCLISITSKFSTSNHLWRILNLVLPFGPMPVCWFTHIDVFLSCRFSRRHVIPAWFLNTMASLAYSDGVSVVSLASLPHLAQRIAHSTIDSVLQLHVPLSPSMPSSTNSPYLPQRSCFAFWTFAAHPGSNSYSADLQSPSFSPRPHWCHHPDQSYQGSLLLCVHACCIQSS